MFLILAFAGVAMRPDAAGQWRRWRAAAWCVLVFSALLHAQIAFYQSFHTPTPDLNVIRAFVALNPAVRGVLGGPRATEEEAIARNDLGTIYMQQGRAAAALEQFEEAARLLPDNGRIRQNLELARRRAGR
jgi:tetratricopeptide (TPR) repeat protein